jgi:hypothetical protein
MWIKNYLTKMAKSKPDDSIHVPLMNPIEKRKSILVTTISVVELIRRFETVKELRKLKVEAMSQFQSVLAELTKLSKEIRLKEMPLNEHELSRVKNVKQDRAALAPHSSHANAPSPRLVAAIVEQKKKQGKMSVADKEKEKVEMRKNSIENQLNALRAKLDTL